jgi:hypothetical protein
MGAKPPTDTVIKRAPGARLLKRTLAMNSALVVGSVRQHELADAASSANNLLLVEISERKQAEEALRRAQAQLTNRAGQLEGLVAERTAELSDEQAVGSIRLFHRPRFARAIASHAGLFHAAGQ